MRLFLAAFIGLILLASVVRAAEPDVILYPRPLSEKDTRFDYHLSLLREALRRTETQFGSFELRPTQMVMNQKRQFKLLLTGSPLLDVVIKPATVERERLLRPVRIPLEKGLLGWRILLIHRRDREAVARIRSLEDLQAFSFGQGHGWSDVPILRHNGLSVTEGNSYEGLFRMLHADRFQLFPRGAGEALHEWDERHGRLDGLEVEQTLLLHYPFARYFWTAANERGRRLRERISMGLESMIADGTFDARFRAYHGEILARARFDRRRLIHLQNPDMPPDMPLGRRNLWFDPFEW